MKLIKTSNNLEESSDKIQDIRLIDELQEGKSLNILYSKSGDIYWLLKSNTEEDIAYDTFSISKEDYEIYSLFDDLYNNIINTRVFNPNISSPEDDLTEEELDELEERNATEIEDCNRKNSSLNDTSTYHLLVQDKVITWHSEDKSTRSSELFRIIKLEDEILIEFIRQNPKENYGYYRIPGSINVRINNMDSKYAPFNNVFIKHFNTLQTFERNPYHQIHIEEYIYQKKKK